MAARAEESWSGAFFAHCPEVLFVSDLDGLLLHQNAAFRHLVGEGIQDGTALLDLVHPEDRSGFLASWSHLRGALAAPVRVVCRLRDAQGGYCAVAGTAGRSTERQEVYGALRTMGAEAERSTEGAQVSYERKMLRILLDNLPILVWAIDGEGNMRFSDGHRDLVTGIAKDHGMGKNLLVEYADKPKNVDSLRRALAGEELHSVVEAYGQWFENWHLPIRDEQGQVVTVFGITLNITEAKRAEKDLRERLELIERQQVAIRDLSTPIIQVWDRVLTLPLLGVVDTGRAAEVMERLLHEISQTGARFAILDLTGVDAMDTASASHLIALIRAVKLLGAEGVITGIRPVVAQTMISLGVDFTGLVTLANLREGLRFCMQRLGTLPSGAAKTP